MEENLRAEINRVNLDHPFFSYLNQDQKNDAIERLQRKVSHTVIFRRGEKDIFAAVIDEHEGGLHIRECGGHFQRHIDKLWIYLLGMLDHLKGDFISVSGTKRQILKLCDKYGFTLNQHGDYEVRFKI